MSVNQSQEYSFPDYFEDIRALADLHMDVNAANAELGRTAVRLRALGMLHPDDSTYRRAREMHEKSVHEWLRVLDAYNDKFEEVLAKRMQSEHETDSLRIRKQIEDDTALTMSARSHEKGTTVNEEDTTVNEEDTMKEEKPEHISRLEEMFADMWNVDPSQVHITCALQDHDSNDDEPFSFRDGVKCERNRIKDMLDGLNARWLGYAGDWSSLADVDLDEVQRNIHIAMSDTLHDCAEELDELIGQLSIFDDGDDDE